MKHSLFSLILISICTSFVFAQNNYRQNISAGYHVEGFTEEYVSNIYGSMKGLDLRLMFFIESNLHLGAFFERSTGEGEPYKYNTAGTTYDDASSELTMSTFGVRGEFRAKVIYFYFRIGRINFTEKLSGFGPDVEAEVDGWMFGSGLGLAFPSDSQARLFLELGYDFVGLKSIENIVTGENAGLNKVFLSAGLQINFN